MTNIVDLGDFVPETYKIGFTINGTRYEFEYAEASVDEVLRLMIEPGKAENTADQQRYTVTEFLVLHAAEKTDKEQLRKDLALVPFKSKREKLDIATIYDTLQGRYTKKKSSGEE